MDGWPCAARGALPPRTQWTNRKWQMTFQSLTSIRVSEDARGSLHPPWSVAIMQQGELAKGWKFLHKLKERKGKKKKVPTCSSCLHCSTAFLPLLLIFQSLVHNLDHWDAEGLQNQSQRKTKKISCVQKMTWSDLVVEIFNGILHLETPWRQQTLDSNSQNAVQPYKAFALI